MYNYNDKKTVIVLASNLEQGIAGNVISHLSLSLGYRFPESDMGKKMLSDATGITHQGISKYPIIVTKVKPGRLKRLIDETRGNDNLSLGDYPKEMLSTSHDNELVSELQKKENKDIEYLGAIIHGDSSIINDLTGKFTLWGS